MAPAHISVDVNTKLVHTIISTETNVANVSEAPKLLRGNETSAYDDAGYIGVKKRVKRAQTRAQLVHCRNRPRAKEDMRVMTLFALANLWMVRQRLLAAG